MGDRSGGRFRFMVLLGSLLMIASGFLPWWHAGGESVSGVAVPASSGIGLEGPGLVIYGAAIAALVLLDIGYMRGRWGFVLDAPIVYLLIGLLAGAALGYRFWELWSVGYLPLPQRSPGLAVAAVGIALMLYGAGTGFGTRRT
ncbi:MAG TPA: hypothetical protein VFX74_07395 [Candidatus Limnocylindria bacterium]|jgi:hypothetical protein|nr:hypothetical protein [Candidatus Limnocylindria bacterium]